MDKRKSRSVLCEVVHLLPAPLLRLLDGILRGVAIIACVGSDSVFLEGGTTSLPLQWASSLPLQRRRFRMFDFVCIDGGMVCGMMCRMGPRRRSRRGIGGCFRSRDETTLKLSLLLKVCGDAGEQLDFQTRNLGPFLFGVVSWSACGIAANTYRPGAALRARWQPTPSPCLARRHLVPLIWSASSSKKKRKPARA